MLGAIFLVISHFCIHGLTLPAGPQDLQLPALSKPVPCHQKQSSKSKVTTQYNSIETLFGSLADLDKFAGDDHRLSEADLERVKEDGAWLKTDNGCFISAGKAVNAMPKQILNEILDDADALQSRQGPAIPFEIAALTKVCVRVCPKLVKVGGKVVKVSEKGIKKAIKGGKGSKSKGKSKGKKKGKKNCKRGEEDCELPKTNKEWKTYISKAKISKERAKEAHNRGMQKMMDSLGDNGFDDMELQKESGCLIAVGQLFLKYGHDMLNVIIAAGHLAATKGHGHGGVERNEKVQKMLRKLYDSYAGEEKPQWNQFVKDVSEFLQKCTGAKIPK